ncbi:hypothetical protein OE88DRAFT_37276 [Heliocybe sulcata]|uniref:Galactose oxidase n=1 Tax=Heliocybe sulcata TaxID=5364 RepID=A0A5C3NGT7_9AGAM|nr:hypothetical protein OE88DRAFT_37276 [Heliocybe sulcata]
MSFFSRKKHPSQGTLPQNVTVSQAPSAALAQVSQGQKDMSGQQQQQQARDMLDSAQTQQQQPNGVVYPQQAPRQNPAPGPGPSQSQLQTQPPQSQSQQPSQQGQGSSGPRPAWPWSQRRLTLPPPQVLPKPGVAPPTSPSPSPFPRYGHAMPMTPTNTGELYLFGGLVRETVRNDLYLFNARDLSATLLQTGGEIPSPRVGHASALVSNVLIVWGGDTKTDSKARPSDKLDDGLYLLNLVSREWTRVGVQGPSPVGRYGHAVTMLLGNSSNLHPDPNQPTGRAMYV